MPNQFQLNPLARALALGIPVGLTSLFSPAARAEHVVAGASVNLSYETPSGGLAASASGSPAAFGFAQDGRNPVGLTAFAPSTGVLTRVDLNLASAQIEQTVTVWGQDGKSFANNPVTALGEFSLQVPGIGLVYYGGPALAECTVAKIDCTATSSASRPRLTPLSVTAPSALDAYVGEQGTVILRPTVLLFAQLRVDSDELGDLVQGAYTAKWDGVLNSTYHYLEHARPSFSANDKFSSALTLDLDFGTLRQGDAIPTLKWAVYNNGNSDTVGLDLDGLSLVGDGLVFNTSLSSFTDLTGMSGSQNFDAKMRTDTPGSFTATYVLRLSDADVGATSTRSTYDLTLNLHGVVTAVPEPQTWAMMLVSLGLLAGLGRWRRATTGLQG